ncbi:toxin-antitoxin system, toxin component [Streptomyces sp. NPDC101132]|uniref:toxin-antitoxin system, toxin component n=1 Tax=Streptomyces sp. NPDC101132 TaxID=3366110 RepID=UPI00381DEC3C
MRVTREMRALRRRLLADTRLPRPADAGTIIAGLCEAFARRRGGRPVDHRFSRFPVATASGLWLQLADRDLIVIEERTRPGHQLVIACHELWHILEGTCNSHGPGLSVAARLAGSDADLGALLGTEQGLRAVVQQAAARAGHDNPAEDRAETFGLFMARHLTCLLPAPEEEQVPPAIERIRTSLGGGH